MPKVLQTPSKPDFNPVEHIWEYINIQLRKTLITNKNALKMDKNRRRIFKNTYKINA